MLEVVECASGTQCKSYGLYSAAMLYHTALRTVIAYYIVYKEKWLQQMYLVETVTASFSNKCCSCVAE
jgi:hypothetical protein